MNHILEIKDLHADVQGEEILKGINLKIESGQVHAIMGPNGSGKSTLLNVIMGHPKYQVTGGDILFNGQSILKLETNKRANLGLFLGFQQPGVIPGVLLGNFLRTAKNANIKSKDKDAATIGPRDFITGFKNNLNDLDLDTTFMGRSINEGFSGGEKKRAEILQMKTLQPHIALLDEIDSGLDIDALVTVAKAIQEEVDKGLGLLIITHYKRILDHIKPDQIHILQEGKITKTGGMKLADELEASGYKLQTT